MGGLQAFHLCGTNPKLFKNLILNDMGAVVSTKGLKRITSYVGKSDGVSGEASFQNTNTNTMAKFLWD